MTDSNLQSIVDRIERLEEKQKALLTEKRGIYTEAKKVKPDLNTKALRRIIVERRMKDREQVEAAMHNYRVALGMATNDVANGASLREAEAKHGIPKSTIQRHRAVPREEKTGMGQPVDGGHAAIPRETKTDVGSPADDGDPAIPGEEKSETRQPPNDDDPADPPETKTEMAMPPDDRHPAVPRETKSEIGSPADDLNFPWFLRRSRTDQPDP